MIPFNIFIVIECKIISYSGKVTILYYQIFMFIISYLGKVRLESFGRWGYPGECPKKIFKALKTSIVIDNVR
jgi:hypothetical protein